MSDLTKIYLYRMTHIENIPHILKFGITHVNSNNASSNFVPIGDNSIIATRNNFILTNGRRLGEYIPFYFSNRTPMLYVIQKGYNMVEPTPAEKIVYCVTSVSKIIELNLEFIFTDGHAIDGFSSQYTVADIDNIEQLIDWKAVKTKYWKNENDLDLKRRKEAEFLVLGDIPYESFLGFIVFNQETKTQMVCYGVNDSIIHIKPEYYF